MTAEHAIRLTSRETDVLRLAAAGGTNKSIAVDLGLSEETVKDFRKAIKHRIGVKSFTHAVAIAAARGLVEVAGA